MAISVAFVITGATTSFFSIAYASLPHTETSYVPGSETKNLDIWPDAEYVFAFRVIRADSIPVRLFTVSLLYSSWVRVGDEVFGVVDVRGACR